MLQTCNPLDAMLTPRTQGQVLDQLAAVPLELLAREVVSLQAAVGTNPASKHDMGQHISEGVRKWVDSGRL